MYLPGIEESVVVNSIFQTNLPFWTALLQLLTCIATKFINIGEPAPVNSAVLGVYSRKLGGSTFPYNQIGFTPLISLIPSVEIGTTRSRKVGRGS
jgi:hypothetical protein